MTRSNILNLSDPGLDVAHIKARTITLDGTTGNGQNGSNEALFKVEEDGLYAIVAKGVVLPVGASATIAVGIAGATGALIPATNSVSFANNILVDKTGTLTAPTVPNATPFYTLLAGQEIIITFAGADTTSGQVQFDLYYLPFGPSADAGSGTSATTTADGANVVEGSVNDAIVSAGAVGTISAKLRRLTSDTGASKTDLDNIATATGAVGDSAYSSGNGSIISVLKGLSASFTTNTTNTTNLNTVEGTIADAAVVSDANGTISAKLRGLIKIFADVWDSTLHGFGVKWLQQLDIINDATSSYEKGWTPVNLTGSGQILSAPGTIHGFFVNSSTAGTVRIADNTASGSGYLGGTITPVVGNFYKYPANVATGGYVITGGTIDVTFFVRSGTQK